MTSREMQRIIIVESNAEIRQQLVKYLNNERYEVVGVGSAIEFYRLIDYSACRIAIIDVSSQDQSCMILVEYLKKNTIVYIVALIDDNTHKKRLDCYKAGADVILIKPFDFDEIAVLINNINSRIDHRNSDSCGRRHHSDDIMFDSSEVLSAKVNTSWTLMSEGWQLISPDGNLIELTLREYKFIRALSRSTAIAVSRKELLQLLEYQNDEYGNRALESLVHRLRVKTEKYGTGPIKTAHGIGYSFAALIKIIY